jgi:catechol 2,3-dioxygenase-like lactoylglutathione lyase family enzyme
MADDRTVPILPCSDIDVMIAFYEALGFRCTYRQVRPNPYAVLERGAIGLHFGAFDGFEPANSYGSCIVVTDDADALYADFAAGIRAMEGRLPVTGIPRFTRPRKKLDVVHGFSVVDPGGNWIRVVQRGTATEGARRSRKRSPASPRRCSRPPGWAMRRAIRHRPLPRSTAPSPNSPTRRRPNGSPRWSTGLSLRLR